MKKTFAVLCIFFSLALVACSAPKEEANQEILSKNTKEETTVNHNETKKEEAETDTATSQTAPDLYLDSSLFPELIVDKNNYKLYSDAQRHGYYYEIYDNSRAQLDYGFAPWNLQEIAVAGENLLVLRTSGNGALFSAKYYDVENRRISRVYGKPAGNSQNLIAYFDTDDQGVKLIVQDIFDARVFYREFRDASFSTPIFTASTHAQFSEGDSSVRLTYMTDNAETVTKTFDLT